MKKKIFLIAGVIILSALVIYYFVNKRGENNVKIDSNNILVVYFSAQEHTKKVANIIKENLNADIFEIEPKDKYTTSDLNYNDNNSRVSKEHNDESLRSIELISANVPNWDKYDTILIGYPIWWGIAAWPVDTFVKSNDFTNKTIIPFCTSASSSLGKSGKNLEKLANGGTWLDGKRFSSSVSENEIKEWTKSITKGE